jgi:hypothetical protein
MAEGAENGEARMPGWPATALAQQRGVSEQTLASLVSTPGAGGRYDCLSAFWRPPPD